MRLAYNTNGLAHHDLLDAINVLAEIGYAGISITLDHNSLNPFERRLDAELKRVREALRSHEFQCVIETGARFLLDPRNKHEPTLVSADASARDRN